MANDFDSWYPAAKKMLHYQRAQNLSSSQGMDNLAEDVVSFHYVSQMESRLIYDLLSKKKKVGDWQELQKLWPSTQESIGHYSRKVTKKEEFQLLWTALTKTIRVVSRADCPVALDELKKQ